MRARRMLLKSRNSAVSLTDRDAPRRLRQSHNPLVPGSNRGGPTRKSLEIEISGAAVTDAADLLRTLSRASDRI
jgi:hypothetical protein